jgi:Lrp/AsnC family leucine-responsive transcriptional regulator
MDSIDRKILDYLQQNGRDSYAEIGKTVGLSVSAINDRIKKLRANGAIRYWSAVIDPALAERNLLAFVSIQLERPEHDKAFIETVAGLTSPGTGLICSRSGCATRPPSNA